MLGHDRATAFEIFERALALTPSSSFTLGVGSTAAAYAGDAERAIEWGERALRPSPFDQMSYLAHHAMALAHFLRGRYEESAQAARRAVQANPSFSMCHLTLVAPLVKLGRIKEAKTVASTALAMQRFSSQRFCAAFDLPPELAIPLTDAWREAGLPP